MFRRRRLLLRLAAILSRREHSRAGALLFLLVMCRISFLLSLCLIHMVLHRLLLAWRSMPWVDSRCRRMLPQLLELQTA